MGWGNILSKNFRKHLQTHSGGKSDKCNQYDFVLFGATGFWKHFETHSGENSNKCNKWDGSLFEASNFRMHLETHSGGK